MSVAMIGASFGLRIYKCSDYTPVFEHRPVGYVLQDMMWNGGANEIKKVAAAAKACYERVSPHDGLGLESIIATCRRGN